MKLRENISAALDGIAVNKLRALLTTLGVVIGVFSVIVMLAVADSARRRVLGEISKLGDNIIFIRSGQRTQGNRLPPLIDRQSLTLDDADAITRECPSVSRTAAEAINMARVRYGGQSATIPIFGITANYPEIRGYKIKQGTSFSEQDVKNMNKVAVIGATTARNLFGEASPLGKTITIMDLEFRITGVSESKGMSARFGDLDDHVFIPITVAMKEVFDLEFVSFISTQAKSRELIDTANEEIKKVLRLRHRIKDGEEPDFITITQAEIIKMASTVTRIFGGLLAGIASISLLVGGIGIMNIMLVSVTERTREIGIRMSVGARRRDIQAQFLMEAVAVSVLGGVVGILLGIICARIITAASDWDVVVSIPSMGLAFGFAAAVGIFFGFYPARKASRLNPIDALRYE